MKRAASCGPKAGREGEIPARHDAIGTYPPGAALIVQEQVPWFLASWSPSALSAVECWALPLYAGAQGSVAALAYHCPAQQRDKGTGTQGRSGASSNKTNVRAADLTRPTADGARRRRPKITGEAALGLAGAELSRPEHHSHRARPASTVSSSRFGEGEAACLPESGGFPLRRSRTLAQSPPCPETRLHFG